MLTRKWCLSGAKNFMEIIVTKTEVFPLWRNRKLGLFNYALEKTNCLKNLELFVSSGLMMASKAVNSLLAVKQSMSCTTLLKRKNAYVSCVFPTISYISALGKPSKSHLRIIESVHQKAAKLILPSKVT